MTDANTGKNLGKCFKVVSQAYEEIDALIAVLKDRLSECFADQWAEGDWKEMPNRKGKFYTDYMCSALLNDDSTLGFQISLTGSGMDLDGNEEPLLHVFRWFLDGEEPGLNYYPLDSVAKIWGDSLIVWPDKKVAYGWTFSLRLVALTNKGSLEKHIIEPIKKLLANSALTQADYECNPISVWGGLVRYNKDEKGQLSIKAPGAV